MRSSRLNYVAVGTFVLALLLGLAAFIVVLSGGLGARQPYHAIYDAVDGVRPGTKVLYQGYAIGTVTGVERVSRDGRTRFRVNMGVKPDFPIPRGSTATVATASLLGGVNIRIDGGDGEPLPPGSRLTAGASGSLFAAVNTVAEQVNAVDSARLDRLIENLNATAKTLDDATAETAPRVAKNLDTFTQALADHGPRIAADLKALSRRLSGDVISGDNAEELDATLGHLAATSRKLDTRVLSSANTERFSRSLDHMTRFSRRFARVSAKLAESRKTLDSLMRQLEATARENRPALRQSVADLRHTMDTVAGEIDSITANLEGTSRNMNAFARQLRRNPSMLLRGREAPAGER